MDLFFFIGFRVLVEQLEKVNVSKMGIDAQTAFWINVYNALLMHVRSALRHFQFTLLIFLILFCLSFSGLFGIWNPSWLSKKVGFVP